MVEWKQINLVENSTLKARIGWQGLTTAEYLDEGYAFLITGTDFFSDTIKWDTCHYVDKFRYDQDSNIQVVNGDILITKDGTIGKVAIVEGLNKKATLNSGVFVIRPKNEIYNNKFMYYVLLSDTFTNFLAKLSAGSTINHLYQKDFVKFECVVPPFPEQRRIAEALSDMDSYIVTLEKLISKKRAIKQGTVQELLTGKRRLVGFSGEWENINLVANSTLKARIGWQGLTTAEYLDEGDAYLITGTDFVGGKIAWETCHYVDQFRYDQDTNIQVRNGDVLITKDGTIGKVAIVSGLNKKATLNSGVFVLRPKSNAYDSRYVYYILLSQIFTEFLYKLAAGSTINHLYQKDFVNFEFDIPLDITEQRAIVSILSDMDAEIDALTAKLNKVRNIKQGMMQELLTGQIRLMKENSKAASSAKVVELPKRKPKAALPTGGHNQQFDDAVMIAGIVNALYSDKYPIGRKKVQKCLYLLRRYQDESTVAFKKKAAGPYADEVRYKGGEPIARSAHYIATTTIKDKGTTFARGKNISQALGYIEDWGGELIDDKKLIQRFETVFSRKQSTSKYVEHFGMCLLRCRFLFDTYMLKREFNGDDTEGRWSLKMLKVSWRSTWKVFILLIQKSIGIGVLKAVHGVIFAEKVKLNFSQKY